jgi:hypothetical protein
VYSYGRLGDEPLHLGMRPHASTSSKSEDSSSSSSSKITCCCLGPSGESRSRGLQLVLDVVDCVVGAEDVGAAGVRQYAELLDRLENRRGPTLHPLPEPDGLVLRLGVVVVGVVVCRGGLCGPRGVRDGHHVPLELQVGVCADTVQERVAVVEVPVAVVDGVELLGGLAGDVRRRPSSGASSDRPAWWPGRRSAGRGATGRAPSPDPLAVVGDLGAPVTGDQPVDHARDSAEHAQLYPGVDLF